MTNHHLPPHAQLLADSRTIAVVGFSATPGKAAHDAPMELVRRGFDVIPVNPRVSEIAGIATVPDLASIDRHVDLVDVFRPAEDTPAIAEQAAAIGADGLWLQLGIVSAEARAIATAAGMAYVEDQCVAPTARQHDLRPPSD